MLKLTRLIFRSILYYWRTSLAAAFGIAVAVAVIVGSLVVGDSVTGSLRESQLSGLGAIDYAVISPTPLHAGLARELASHAGLSRARFAPVMIIVGSVRNADTDTVAPDVNVLGVDSRFFDMYKSPGSGVTRRGTVAVSEGLAADLGLKPGASIILSVPKSGAIPSESLFASRELSDTAASTRLDVVDVLPAQGPAGFRLSGSSGQPRTVILDISELSEMIGSPDKANAVVADIEDGDVQKLEKALAEKLNLEDYGLSVASANLPNTLTVRSSSITLSDHQLAAVKKTAKRLGLEARLASTYLATRLTSTAEPSKHISYAMVGGIEGFPAEEVSADNRTFWLNEWAARDLGAKPGQEYKLEYLLPRPDGTYHTLSLNLKLRGVLPMEGFASDRTLAPLVQGITDAARVGDWKAPFPVDLSRVTQRDEEYWDTYRAAPKVFVSPSVAQMMWSSAVPDAEKRWVTSILLSPRSGWRHILSFRSALEKAFLTNVSPADSGIAVRALRARALTAAKGNTDFRTLFVSMSFFIFLAGLGMAAGLMKLAADARASEAGIMLAVGLKLSQVSNVIAGEGAVISLIGTIFGLPLGLLYAYGLVRLIGGSWSGAVASANVTLHVSWGSVVTGAAAGFIAGCVSSWVAAKAYRDKSVVGLLNGGKWTTEAMLPPKAASAWLPAALGSAAVILVLLSAAGDAQTLSWVFYLAGSMLLIAGILGAKHLLQRIVSRRANVADLRLLALRYASSNRARSLLIVGMLACAVFIIVTAAANVSNLRSMDFRNRNSGAGGFALRIVTTLPLGYDIGTAAGRGKLGFQPADEDLLRQCKFVSFLMSPGDDVSCLNLNRPVSPRLLGVGQDMVLRGGFGIAAPEVGGSNGWQRLTSAADAAIPAFGDANSVVWTLHSGLGKEYEVRGRSGQPSKVEFLELLPNSIFAGEILISRENFLKLYPGLVQPRYFLIETPKGREAEVAAVLGRGLGDYGVQVRSTTEILSGFARVQDTYLSMFIALGGLGLLLGTLGLVIVVLRNAIERRSQFALMSASGITRGRIAAVLLLENAFLIAAGVVIGCFAAIVAVSSRLKGMQSGANWPAIIAVLAAIALTGLLSTLAAAKAATKGDLISALREE